MGNLHFFLDIKVYQLSNGFIILKLDKYIKSLLSQAHLSNAKPTNSPMVSPLQLYATNGVTVDDTVLYRIIFEALQYVTLTRLDISVVVNKVHQFMDKALDNH